MSFEGEQYHMTDCKYYVEDFHPNDSHEIIGSSYKQAFNNIEDEIFRKIKCI